MAQKKSVSPAVAVVVVIVVLLVVAGLGYKFFLAPKGGQVGAKMGTQDVQNMMKQKGMMQPPGPGGSTGGSTAPPSSN